MTRARDGAVEGRTRTIPRLIWGYCRFILLVLIVSFERLLCEAEEPVFFVSICLSAL
jgi:hypothetical protein